MSGYKNPDWGKAINFIKSLTPDTINAYITFAYYAAEVKKRTGDYAPRLNKNQLFNIKIQKCSIKYISLLLDFMQVYCFSLAMYL